MSSKTIKIPRPVSLKSIEIGENIVNYFNKKSQQASKLYF